MALGSLAAPGRCHGLRWFLAEVWARFRERNPDARLKVIGAHPRRDISAHNGHEGVTVHGFLERLEPELADVDLCIIPLFIGQGIRIKVLEMISRGIPCLGTQLAFQGLPAVRGCLRADEPEEWVDALVAAAADPDLLASAASRGARELTKLHATEEATAHLREVMSKVGVAAG